MLIDDFPMLKSQVTDLLVCQWLLRKLEDIALLDEDEANLIETSLFNDMVIKKLLKSADDELLTSVFRRLHANTFVNHLSTLIKNWPNWKDTVACWSAPIIAQLDQDKAYALFLNYLNNRKFDVDKLHGILEGIPYLDDNHAKKLADLFIDIFLQDQSEEIDLFFGTESLILAWQYMHPQFDGLARRFFISFYNEDKDRYRNKLSIVCSILNGSWMDYNIICDKLEKISKLQFNELTPFFQDAELLIEFDKHVELIRRKKFSAVLTFVKEHSRLVQNERLKNLLLNLINDSQLRNQLHKAQRQYFYAMLLSFIVSSTRLPEPDFSNLSLEEGIQQLTADYNQTNHLQFYLDFFHRFPKDEVIDCLIKILPNNYQYYGGQNIIEIMGRFRDERFLLPLCNSLFEENDFIHSTAVNSLINYKEKAVDIIVQQFPRMDYLTRMSAFEVLGKIGGPKVVELIDRHFELLWKENRENVLYLIQDVPDERFIEKLAPYTTREQAEIDRTYLILCRLYGHSDPQIEALAKSLELREKEKQEFRQAFREGRIADTIRPYIKLKLKCMNCGDENKYKVKKVMVCTETNENYIADEIRCYNCGQIAEFDFTSEAMITLTAETMRLVMVKESEKDAELISSGPLQFVQPRGLDDKIVGFKNIIETYKKEIAKEPNNPEHYVGLGNFYRNTNQFTRAKELYQKAISLDPSYVESYYSLAFIAEQQNDFKQAFHFLEEGRKHLNHAKLRRTSNLNRREFLKDYLEYYNEMAQATGLSNLHIHPNMLKKKISRNDPCPCGSGKKYKHCCMIL